MKKSIAVVAKRISCLVMICALVMSSYPIQAIAADFDSSQQSVTNENTDQTEESKTVSDEASQGESSSAPRSEEVSESEPSSKNEPEGETDKEETSKEETNEEKTSEEETNEEKTSEEETNEEKTSEKETSEEETSEEGTSEEETSEEETSEESETDTLDITIGEVNISLGTPVYKYDKDTNARYYVISVNASAAAGFTGDVIDEDKLQETRESIASSYSVELMDATAGKSIAHSDLHVNDEGNISIDTLSVSDIKLTKSDTYKWCIEVKKDGNVVKSASKEVTVTIPDAIGVQIGTPEIIAVKHTNVTDENGKCTGFQVEPTIAVSIELTNLSSTVDILQRREEIEKILSKYKIKVQKPNWWFWQEIISVPLDNAKIVDALIKSKGAKQTVSLETNYELKDAATYLFRAELNGSVSGSCEYTIDKLDNEIEYTPSKQLQDGEAYRYNEDITYNHANGYILGNAECYESDAAGKELTENKVLKIERGNNGFKISVKKNDKQESTHYITIKQAGNSIYNDSYKTYALKYKRVDNSLTASPSTVKECYAYKEKVIYTVTGENITNEIECYESDKEGNRLSEEISKLAIKPVGQAFEITAPNVEKADKSEHYITFVQQENAVYNQGRVTCFIKFARLENEIKYEASTGNEVQHEYGEAVTYKCISGNTAGGVICYESDIDGNKLENANNLKITKDKNGNFKVQGIQLSEENKPFYVTMEHAENEVYKRGSQTFEFYVNKIELQGGIEVRDVKKNGIFYNFFKADNMYVEVTAAAMHENLSEQEAKAINFELIAVLDSDNDEALKLEVEKVEKKYNKDKAAATYLYTISKESSKILKTNEVYTVQATANYDALSAPVHFEPYCKAFYNMKALASELKITNYLSELNVEYSKEEGKFRFDIIGNNLADFDIVCKVEAKDPTILDIDNAGNYKTLKSGETSIIISADDVPGYDVYVGTSVEIPVIVTSPQNTDYTLNGMSREEFLNHVDRVVAGEDGKEQNWYAEEITLRFGEKNLYTGLCYSTDGGKSWTKVNAREFVIRDSMPTDYEFYFYNQEVDIASNRVKENEVLQGIAVDTTSPVWNTQLTASQKPSIHSTETISYFPTQVTLTGSADKNKKVDAGSGIEKVCVQYGNSNKWEEVIEADANERYSSSYQITLSDNKLYGNVKLKVVDYLGHESEIAEYKKSVCVDNVVPVVTAAPVDEAGNAVNYNGEWTNQQLCYAVSLIADKQVSGIYKYEYAFIPRGSNTALADAEWEEINKKDLEVVFGTVLNKEQKELEGTILYPDSTVKSKAVSKIKTYSKLNGTLYFRAESNAGLVTARDDSMNHSQQIRIWQADLAAAKVKADNKPNAATGWYNMETKDVNISFEYPKYDEKNYAPAIGIVYEIATITENNNNPQTERRQFYKGIIDETTGKVIEVSDYHDAASKTSLAENGTIHIDTDGITTLKVHVEDAAGNKSDITTFEIKADFIAPQNVAATADGEALKLHFSSEEGITYGKFSQSSVQVSASAEYGISQKQNLYMALAKDNGEKAALSGDNAKDSLTMEPCTRGLVYLCAVDGAGNKSEAWTDGIVVDNLAPIGNNQQEISIVAKGKNEAGFYNKDIQISLSTADAPANDNYAGLKSVSYTVGKDGQSTEGDITVYDNSAAAFSWNQIASSHNFETDNIVMDAAKNESNAAYITVTATDHAGNSSTVTQEFQIDITKPQIEVLFDKNNGLNHSYYNSNRAAQINITELNFDPAKVSFTIYKDGKEDYTLIPNETSWKALEGNVHTTYITFAEDGDYSLEVQCTDLAGNESDKEVTETFTIDKTKPVVEVTYDNNNAWKENYYNQARTATITITEHNFDEKDFEAVITPHAALGSWTHQEDVHRVTVRFDSEEHYSYTIDYTDLAGNEMDAFTTEEFYIDMNAPTIQISGVEDHSANAGDVIPVVAIEDANYDIDSVQITLQNSKGQQIAVNRSTAGNNQGYSYTLTNVNEQPDEIYTLSVNTTDMAGNESDMSVHFSLNRNGSVYDLSQISALVDKAYIRYIDLQDLQIQEMNVNTIEEFSIYVTRNGEMIASSQKNTRPGDVDTNTIYYGTQVNGNDEIGYEYNYTIYRESFQQEGIYNIMFYSKDKAGNEVNNTLTEKEAELTFVVDNTAPTVVVEGIEEGALYTEETKDINVYVADNFKLQEAYFNLVDEDGNIVQTYDYMELAKEEGDIVTLTLPSSDKKQSIQYYAIDVAGNDITTLSEEDVAASFTISTNAWIRYTNNKKAIAVTVAAGACIVAAGTGIFFRRRKKTQLLQNNK